MSDWDLRLKTIRAMEQFGGSFVKALAECMRRADQQNYAKLEAAFPEYFEKYRNVQMDEDGRARASANTRAPSDAVSPAGRQQKESEKP